MTKPSFPSHPEATYYQTIEDFFVARRGDSLFLSSADWVLVDSWRRSGIPLRIVLRGIADALDSHAHSWGRKRKVGSLRYCSAEVEAARERFQQALSQGAPDAGDIGATLKRLADEYDRAEDSGEAVSELVSGIARQLRQRAESPDRPEKLESWLAEREATLVAAIRNAAPPEQLATIEMETAAVLDPYRSRMPPRVLAQLQADGVTRRLLQKCGLPRLSLLLI